MTGEIEEQAPAASPQPAAGRIEELYRRNAPGALRLAYFLTGDREQAEDLVQEAFVRVAGRFRHLRVPDAFDGYLRRTIVNLFTSQLRRRKLERAYAARQRGVEPFTTPDDPALRDELWSALATLPSRQRAAVVLRYYEDLSERETAEILGVSTGAVSQLIVRALSQLRTHVRGDDA